MRKGILFFWSFVLIISASAQSNKNGVDTLKQNLRNIGNVFKKAGTIRFIINNINNNNNDLLLLQKNIQQTINVKKVEPSTVQNIVTFKISYKGKASDLWNTLSANAKQAFKLNEINDTLVNLDYKYANMAAETASLNNNQPAANNNSISNSADNNTLSKGAALLFKNVKTTLTINQKNKIFDSLGIKISKDEKKFIIDDDSGDYPFDALVYPTDLNKDGKEEIFITYGNTFTSGNTGVSIAAFIEDKNGVYKTNLNFPGLLPEALTTINFGYPDLLIGGPGMEFPIWRWNGNEYNFLKELKDADYPKLKTTSIEDLSKAYINTIKN